MPTILQCWGEPESHVLGIGIFGDGVAEEEELVVRRVHAFFLGSCNGVGHCGVY